MTKIEDMRVGDWVRWNSRDWEVTDRDTFRESADYTETQWELTPVSGDPQYLVRSLENKNGAAEEVWVCTKQTGITGVEHAGPDGQWRRFSDKDAIPAPPSRARLGDTEFRFDGQSEADAEDDEGDTVTKLTWDYYDQARRRNLAIEIWKEPDADYYEAYDGRVVSKGDFAPLPPRPSSGRRRAGGREDVASLVIAAAFACFFFLPIVGGFLSSMDIGAEYLVALLLPAGFIYFCLVRAVHRGLLAAALAGAFAAALLLIKFRGLGASYWEYAFYGLLAGPALAELGAGLFGGVRSSDKAWTAAASSLLLLFILSFAHYVNFAPRPHNPGGLLVACLLPALPALAVFMLYFFKGGSDEQA